MGEKCALYVRGAEGYFQKIIHVHLIFKLKNNALILPRDPIVQVCLKYGKCMPKRFWQKDRKRAQNGEIGGSG
ncbi:hypothetical protein BKM32_08935 [Mangrovimonas sp. DI 80]|nr:hypothetical protein BKM32_08935 [Mangrovimonas sp. DI 80]